MIDFRKERALKILVELLEVTREAQDHGDAWERECAKAQQLDKKLDAAIATADNFLNPKVKSCHKKK